MTPGLVFDRQTRVADEHGYLLMTTLALLLFFTVTLVAVLTMTMTALATTSMRVQRSETLRFADSALEEVINDRRLDRVHAASATTVGVPCPGTSTVGTISNAYDQIIKGADGTDEHVAVSCTGAGSNLGRQFVLRSYVNGTLGGMASVRLDDRLGPGEVLIICDWQLGDNAAAVPAVCA